MAFILLKRFRSLEDCMSFIADKAIAGTDIISISADKALANNGVMFAYSSSAVEYTGHNKEYGIPPVIHAVDLASLVLPEQVHITTVEGLTLKADVVWTDPKSVYDPDESDEQIIELTGTITLPAGVTNTDSLSLANTHTVKVLAENLVSVTAPTDVTGIPSGSPKTSTGLGLPSTVTIVTDGTTIEASVLWSVVDSDYDPEDITEQIITIDGLVLLPTGITNLDDVSLEVDIDVTINAMEELASITAPTAITGLTNGVAKTVAGLTLPSTVTIVTDGVIDEAVVTWDVAGCTYVPETTTEQVFNVSGLVTLPLGVANTAEVSLAVTVSVTVSAVA